MTVKCIAIGNRILMDDGIGIRIAEELTSKLIQEHIEVIIGETDLAYALSLIQPGDFLFILDASYYNLPPGYIHISPIVDITDHHPISYTQHQPSFIDIMKQTKDVAGYLIGIEIETIDYGLELSNTLNAKLQPICSEVYEFITKTVKGI